MSAMTSNESAQIAPMPAGSAALGEREFAVLNAIHLKRLATTEQVAAVTAIDTAELASVLAVAASAGHVLSMESGHLLLPDGTAAVRRHYHERYAALRTDPAIGRWYARFETLNSRFIALLSAWQQMGSDERQLRKALEVVDALCTALDELLPLLPRYVEYQRRFEDAVAAIDSGDTDLLCNPRRDSAHNIWFELHEDILGVLGRPRDTT